MPSSVRMDNDLQVRLRTYAAASERSASEVVRAAVTQYLNQQSLTSSLLGEALFGKYRSQPDAELPASERSSDRKSILRARMLQKHPRP